jgi:hypothetical protein
MKITFFCIKMTIFLKKMEFSFFLKIPIKRMDKKYILLVHTLFSFFTLLFFKKIKKVKVGQKLGKKVGYLSFLIFYINST